jgi:hypothetical protein
LLAQKELVISGVRESESARCLFAYIDADQIAEIIPAKYLTASQDMMCPK